MKAKAGCETARRKARGDFLFEIGCEEIPAGMIAKASQELKAILEKYFSTNGLLDDPRQIQSKLSVRPRRLMAIAHSVRLRQEDVDTRNDRTAEIRRVRQSSASRRARR